MCKMCDDQEESERGQMEADAKRDKLRSEPYSPSTIGVDQIVEQPEPAAIHIGQGEPEA